MLGAVGDAWLIMGATGSGLQVWLKPGVQEGNEQSALGKGTAWRKAGRWECSEHTQGGKSVSILVIPVSGTRLSGSYESSPLHSHNPLGHRDEG